jgi:hypothetical protein
MLSVWKVKSPPPSVYFCWMSVIMMLHGYVIDILWTLFTSIRLYSCQNYAMNDPIVIITPYLSIIKWPINVPSTPDIYFRTVQLTCFILSFCLSGSQLKGQGYTIPTEKDLFPWRKLNFIIFWLVYKWPFGWACNWQQKRSFYQNTQACKCWIWDIQPNSITMWTETPQPADIAQSLPTLENVLKLASHLENTHCIS